MREGTRDQVDCKITLRPDVADQITTDSSIRTMIFCASEPISHFAKVDIAFPHQVEIKVNMDEVKANLRGLKNKSGSTRPPDITALLRKRANYENLLSLTYALTHKVRSRYTQLSSTSWLLPRNKLAMSLIRWSGPEILLRGESCEETFRRRACC